MELIKDFKIEEYNNKTYIIFPNGIYDIENMRIRRYLLNYKNNSFDVITTNHKIEDILNSRLDFNSYLLYDILLFDINGNIIYTHKLKENKKLVYSIDSFSIVDIEYYHKILEYEKLKLSIKHNNINKE